MNRNDGVVALCGLAIAIVALLILRSLPFGTARETGPAFFPTLLAIVILLFSLILLGQFLKARKADQKGGETRLTPVRLGPHSKRILPAVAGMAAFVFLLKPIGFLLCTLLLTLLFVALVSRSWKLLVLIPVVSTLSSYALFGWLLKNPLPKGILHF